VLNLWLTSKSMNRLITNYEAVYSSNGFSMSLDLFTTVRLPSLVIFTISWREFFCRLGQSAALTLHLAKWIENSSTNRARTIWVLRHPHVNWGNSIFKKKKRLHRRGRRPSGEWEWYKSLSQGWRIVSFTRREGSGGFVWRWWYYCITCVQGWSG
jgi:hypothetical protein